MFGFRFEDDDEAYQFYETVMVRTKARREITFHSISFHLCPSHLNVSVSPPVVSLSSSGKTERRPTRVEQSRSPPIDDVVRPSHRPNRGP